MTDLVPLIVALSAFGCIAAVVFVIGRYLSNQASVSRRLSASTAGPGGAGFEQGGSIASFLSSVTDRIDEKKFGIEGGSRAKLRLDLMRAGYFSGSAIRIYILVRLGAVIIIPATVFIIVQNAPANFSSLMTILFVVFSTLAGMMGPDVYLARRKRLHQWEYRITFPDLTDMLVVCVDAGLSLSGALNRIWPEISRRNRALGINLAILGAETRAGRSLPDALNALAERLDLDEARAFATLLRQSIELGTDVGDALRVFSDEMRTKRLLRAEEMANKLPVKIVLPLGAFIFPVILMTVMVPTIIRLLAIFSRVH